MTLRSLFAQNPNIIINSDIDGILSGLLLVKYCQCNIVGFTNSKEYVWLADDHDDLYGSVYVDMFVTDPRAMCIDQHIVALNDEHMQAIRNNRLVFSPQSDDENNLRVFSKWGFKNKYPFGTFQYLVAKLESEGIHVELPDLYSLVPNSSITVGDLLNRPDDAMNTTICSSYIANAKNWWNWLETMAPNGSIKQLRGYLDYVKSMADKNVDDMPFKKGKKKHTAEEYNDQRGKVVEEIKKLTEAYFKKYQCKSKDCDFKIIVDNNGILLSNVAQFADTIASILGMQKVTLPQHYITHKGIRVVTRWDDIFAPEFLPNYYIAGHKIFSYAFTYSPDNDHYTNFSLTIDMQ